MKLSNKMKTILERVAEFDREEQDKMAVIFASVVDLLDSYSENVDDAEDDEDEQQEDDFDDEGEEVEEDEESEDEDEESEDEDDGFDEDSEDEDEDSEDEDEESEDEDEESEDEDEESEDEEDNLEEELAAMKLPQLKERIVELGGSPDKALAKGTDLASKKKLAVQYIVKKSGMLGEFLDMSVASLTNIARKNKVQFKIDGRVKHDDKKKEIIALALVRRNVQP